MTASMPYADPGVPLNMKFFDLLGNTFTEDNFSVGIAGLLIDMMNPSGVIEGLGKINRRKFFNVR